MQKRRNHAIAEKVNVQKVTANATKSTNIAMTLVAVSCLVLTELSLCILKSKKNSNQFTWKAVWEVIQVHCRTNR